MVFVAVAGLAILLIHSMCASSHHNFTRNRSLPYAVVLAVMERGERASKQESCTRRPPPQQIVCLCCLCPLPVHRCPMVIRAPHTNPGTQTVYRPANLTTQQWKLDPEYYWFKTCDCAQVGFGARGCMPCIVLSAWKAFWGVFAVAGKPSRLCQVFAFMDRLG